MKGAHPAAVLLLLTDDVDIMWYSVSGQVEWSRVGQFPILNDGHLRIDASPIRDQVHLNQIV